MVRGLGSAVVCLILSLFGVAHAEPCVPTLEQCNGLDDDCNGLRDGISESCFSFGAGCAQDPATTQWTCKGFCKPGLKTCTAQQVGGTWTGVWGDCIGEVGPEKETCDGMDEDCDGVVDNEVNCPGDAKCVEGKCIVPIPCKDRQDCPDEWWYSCVNGWCVENHLPPDDFCANVTCGSKYEKCNAKGICVDVSCYNPQYACPPGQICVQGICQADQCAGVSCGPDSYCDDGTCVTLCDALSCPTGHLCKVVISGGKPETRCVADPCADVTCSSNLICRGGECIVAPCSTVACEQGEVCQDGTCLADRCETIRCPAGYTCKQDTCMSEGAQASGRTPEVTDRGCTCDTGVVVNRPFAGLLLLALLGATRILGRGRWG